MSDIDVKPWHRRHPKTLRRVAILCQESRVPTTLESAYHREGKYKTINYLYFIFPVELVSRPWRGVLVLVLIRSGNQYCLSCMFIPWASRLCSNDGASFFPLCLSLSANTCFILKGCEFASRVPHPLLFNMWFWIVAGAPGGFQFNQAIMLPWRWGCNESRYYRLLGHLSFWGTVGEW